MPATILGLLFLVFGGVSIWDGQRIASTIRKRGTLDVIGPDGYLEGTAVLLIVVGVLLLVQGVIAWRRARAAVTYPTAASPAISAASPATLPATSPAISLAASSAASTPPEASPAGDDVSGSTASTTRHITLLGVLVAYAVALPFAGYAIATAVAMTALFRIMGVRGWLKVVLWAVATTAVFYIGFVVVADLPLPAGLLRIG